MMNFGRYPLKGLDLNMEAGMPVSNKLSFQLAGTYTWQKAVDITDPAKKNYKHQIRFIPGTFVQLLKPKLPGLM